MERKRPTSSRVLHVDFRPPVPFSPKPKPRRQHDQTQRLSEVIRLLEKSRQFYLADPDDFGCRGAGLLLEKHLFLYIHSLLCEIKNEAGDFQVNAVQGKGVVSVNFSEANHA